MANKSWMITYRMRLGPLLMASNTSAQSHSKIFGFAPIRLVFRYGINLTVSFDSNKTRTRVINGTTEMKRVS